MKKNSLFVYGLVSGILLCLIFFLPYYLWGSEFDMELGEAIGYGATFIALALGVLAGIRWKRDKENNGKISFNAAFRSGVFITLIASIVVYLSTFIFLELNGREWLSRYYNHKVEKIRELSTDPAAAQARIDQFAEEWKKNSMDIVNSSGQALMIFFIVLLLGSIISLAAAAIQRRT